MGRISRLALVLLLGIGAIDAHALVLCGVKKGDVLKDGSPLRVRTACKPREIEVDPAALGLQGPAGATGAPGTPGSTGPVGPSDAFSATDLTNLFPGQDEMELFTSRTLPPGSYVVFAHYHIENNGLVGERADVACRLQVGDASDYAIVTVPAREASSGYTDGIMSLMVVTELAEETTATLSCGEYDTASTVFGQNARIVAIRVQSADIQESF